MDSIGTKITTQHNKAHQIPVTILWRTAFLFRIVAYWNAHLSRIYAKCKEYLHIRISERLHYVILLLVLFTDLCLMKQVVDFHIDVDHRVYRPGYHWWKHHTYVPSLSQVTAHHFTVGYLEGSSTRVLYSDEQQSVAYMTWYCENIPSNECRATFPIHIQPRILCVILLYMHACCIQWPNAVPSFWHRLMIYS